MTFRLGTYPLFVDGLQVCEATPQLALHVFWQFTEGSVVDGDFHCLGGRWPDLDSPVDKSGQKIRLATQHDLSIGQALQHDLVISAEALHSMRHPRPVKNQTGPKGETTHGRPPGKGAKPSRH